MINGGGFGEVAATVKFIVIERVSVVFLYKVIERCFSHSLF